MVAVDKPPKVGSLRVLGANEPASAEFENVDSLLATVLGFKLTMGEPNTQVPFKELTDSKDPFREDPEPREGDMACPQGLDRQPLINDDHVYLVKVLGNPLVVVVIG